MGVFVSKRICGLSALTRFEVIMPNWKKTLVFASLGAGAVMFVTGRRGLGMGFAAAGLTILASEYPETFEAVWEKAPDYLQKGRQIFGALQKLGEGYLEEAERRGASTWREMREQYGD